MTARRKLFTALAALALLGACGSSDSDSDSTATTSGEESAAETADTTTAAATAPVEFVAEVWADNWFSLAVNGEVVGEDSVPITTERSFNSEAIEFSATYPLTIGLVAKDYKENDSGLEYIGTDRQQMGDGGVILQLKEKASGKLVATTNAEWKGLVIHRAPLDKSCESAGDPTAECQSESSEEPAGWLAADFDDSAWDSATEYTAEEVDAKQGYDDITWDPAATLIWSQDLLADNTILWRYTVAAA